MVIFPNCKINLGLNITAKRPDGYHDISSVFFPLQLQDALEIIRPGDTAKEIVFTSTGLVIPGNAEENLCVKAYHLLKKDHPGLPAVHLHLHKAIPMGAGLGGGSADGFFTLSLLNQYFNLGLSREQLAAYALGLGSDCPFFMYNTPCFAEGRGEKLQPISLDLSGYRFLLVHPGVHVSTAWAFSQISPAPPATPASEIVSQPVESWKEALVNDFEKPIVEKFPVIGEIKTMLYRHGAVYAAMTGSGSSLFGIFKRGIPLPSEAFNGYNISTIDS